MVNKILIESTRSIRDIHLHGVEDFFIGRFGAIGSQGKRYDQDAQNPPRFASICN